jgi:hypothetical protein
MEVGESVRGKDLVQTEKDLLVMRGDDHMVHIVFDGRICRPDAIDGIPDRGVRLWTKFGCCKRHQDFEIEVLSLEGKPCKRCMKMLKRNGIVLRKVR